MNVARSPRPAATLPLGRYALPVTDVFISYVREDSAEVDLLQRALQAANIDVWRDTEALRPGDDWRAEIRKAISHDARVVLACFSRKSLAREVSYQNEELAQAIDAMRLRRPDVPWLIPVRFDDCEIPEFDIGRGRTVRWIQCADLFGDQQENATARLVDKVLQILTRDPNDLPQADLENLETGGQQDRAIGKYSLYGPDRDRDRADEYRARSIAATTVAMEALGELRDFRVKPDWVHEHNSYAGKETREPSIAEKEAVGRWEQERVGLLGPIKLAILDIGDSALRDRIGTAVRVLELWRGPTKYVLQSEGRTRHLAVTDALEAIGAYRRGDHVPDEDAEYRSTIGYVEDYVDEMEVNIGF